MSISQIKPEETGLDTGQPVELYVFQHGDVNYLFTSDAQNITIPMSDGTTKTFYADTIQRENIKPGSSGNTEACIVRVDKDNAVAKLYEGAPPEIPVKAMVYRLHASDLNRWDIVMRAQVTQVQFEGSECQLTCTMDAWLQKELPNGMNQYYCGHSVFDHNCGLKKSDYAVEALIDKVEGLHIYSSKFAEYADGYFEGGRLYHATSIRMIAAHKGNCVTLKYPCTNIPRNIVTVVPGCDQLFSTCAKRYHNTLNFSGIPYCPPTDPEKNPTGQGTYWIDSLVVQRDTNGYVGTITI